MKINIVGIIKKVVTAAEKTSLPKDLQDAARNIVADLSTADLSGAAKRKEAIKRISSALKKKYGPVRDYLIGLAIELAVAELKSK